MNRRDALFLIVALHAVAFFACMRLYWDVWASPIRGSDFSSYYTAGRLLAEGRAADLYAVAPGDSILGDATAGPWAEAGARAGVTRQHYYIYPPVFALLARPLSALPFRAALDLWLGLDLLLLGLFGLLWARLRGPEFSLPEGAVLVSLALFEFLPLIWAMAIGQTSLIVLVLLTGTLLAWRRGRDVAAGVLLGLAIAIKLTPALVTIFFWWRGRRRLAVVSAAVFAATQAIAVAVLGWDLHRQFFLEIVPEMSGGTCYFLNQSIGAFFNRLLTAGDVRQVDLVDAPIARGAAIAVSLGILAASAPFLRRLRPGIPLCDEVQFGAVVLMTLVLSPISWTHHYLIALLPILALAAHLGREPIPPLARAVLLGLAFLLIARKPHADLFLHGAARVFNSAALAGALALWGLSLHALRRRPGEATP